MSNTVMEMLRSKHEEVEQLEKALSKAISFKDNNPKEKVIAEIVIKKCVDLSQKRCKEILALYEDKDNSFKNEAQVFLGKKLANENANTKRKPDIWYNFYEKIKELKRYNKRSLNSNDINENISGEKIFNLFLDEVNNKQIFTSEENKGKCIDLHYLYQEYLDLKGIYELNNSKIIDYLTYVNTFQQFSKIPMKNKLSKDYLIYIQNLSKYLKDFFRKIHPLIEFNDIQDIIDTKFESDWKEKNILGWTWLKKSQPSHNDKDSNQENLNDDKNETNSNNIFYCSVCNKSFVKDSLYQSHLKGKKHLNKQKQANKEKGIFEVPLPVKNDNDNQNSNNDNHNKEERKNEDDDNNGEYESLREIAYYEYQILQYRDLLLETIENTKNQIRKKQSMNLKELEADVITESALKKIDVNEEDNKPIYNPKNIPIGWDGKPIPYWLYKIHGLGIEYKCEICGGASYWGRKAFERHFQEWRHTYGMKCLGLPNTLQFKEVTNIEDALSLNSKILEKENKLRFRPEVDEEFEDDDGNVVNRKMYLDLQRQGLINNEK